MTKPRVPASLFILVAVIACGESHTNQSAGAINKPFSVAGVRVEPDSLNAYLATHRGFTSKGGEMRCAYRPLGQSGARVFVWAVCTELLAVDGRLIDGSGMSLPAAFKIAVDNGRPRIVGVEIPADGSGYGPSIRRIFPADVSPATFRNGGRDQPGAGIGDYLRREAAARFGLPAAAAIAPRVHDMPLDARGATNNTVALESTARRVVEFLRGSATFASISLSDTVAFYVSAEGGGGRARIAREKLRNPSAWVVRSAGRDLSLAPPAGLTRLTTKAGRHFNCTEQPLAEKFPQLARLPHVGTMLQPENRRSCLQSWSMTFVFDRSARPRVIAVAYDQWEW